ncbi:MAG TPA: M14 family zinc carboxypeptidase [Thermoanaerobaculia bacterium]|nr:M14 family zinc carboxypeptidase [Thermoanaerobaculia bacterium]
MKRWFAAFLLSASAAFSQDVVDATYTAAIREFTTEPRFMTELVDHLPASDTVPSPLEFNGYIAGANGHLTYAEDVYRYMRALEAASPRVRVFSIGRSEEGREMILVAISDEATISNLDRYREITRRLSDPRGVSEEEARRLIAEGKPIYYATGAMHSPETASPEMLMELAFRLTVGESPMIRSIRENVIVLLTPVIEVDGRNRMVDLWRYRKANPDLPTPPLIYWGHHVAHDNNRDNISLALNLSRNVMGAYFDFHPQVFHDLHESVPFLYVSTGTGPYNPALDPLVIDEWHRMAYNEVNELTRRGLPGVWTHGFYDGWAPSYMFWIGLGHNSIGRFYETFGHRWPTTENRVVRSASERTWYRPNPPLPQVRWSLRNNVNYQQSALLLAFADMAEKRERFLENFWMLSKRSVAKPDNEGPAAYVFTADQKRLGQLHDLLGVFGAHGVEVHQVTEAFTIDPGWPPPRPRDDEDDEEKPAKADDESRLPDEVGSGEMETADASDTVADDAGEETAEERPAEQRTMTFPAGSFVIRMDQPYSRLADALLDVQYVRSDERAYDDTGWPLGWLKNVESARVANREVLSVPMTRWQPAASSAHRGIFALENTADTALTKLRFRNPAARMSVVKSEFEAEGTKFPAGTILYDGDIGGLHLRSSPLTRLPSVESVPLRTPRIALMHTWIRTQDEGWYRLALESMGVPYDYISTQDVARTPDLRRYYDVILFPPAKISSSTGDIVNGLPPGPPLPWKKSALTPNLGVPDETDDMRPGLGLAGVQNLARFVEGGGLLITALDTSTWAIDYGLVRWVETVRAQKLKAPGSIVLAAVTDEESPIAAGYDETVPLFFGGSPIFRVGVRHESPAAPRQTGRGGKDDPDVPQGRVFVPLPEREKPEPGEEGFQYPEDMPSNWEAYMPRPEDRPRVIVSFAKKADELLMSGMLEGGEELAGKPAVILSPRGRGNILLMAVNPMWRMNTDGSYALVMNAIMNWDSLR